MNNPEEDEGGKVTVHGNIQELLFGGGENKEIKVKQNLSPYNKKSKDDKRKSKAPQLQKPPIQRNSNIGYGQKYSQKKSFVSPMDDKNYSPIPQKGISNNKINNPLFQANPLPDLHEEIKGVNQYMPPSYMQQEEPQVMSNYDFHNQQSKFQNMPHEMKKADFERNRRSNIANVSQNIVSSRENQRSTGPGLSQKSNITRSTTNISDTKISHSKNTNKGYVKMRTGSDISQSQTDMNISVGQQYDIVNKANGEMGKKVNKRNPNSIVSQYSHNLPPHQIDYQSGFQQIPSPKYNVDEQMMALQNIPRPVANEKPPTYGGLDYSYYTNEQQTPQKQNIGQNNADLGDFEQDPNVINVPARQSKPSSKRNNHEREQYKPYTLKEYKEKHDNDPKMLKMGGLGANIGTEDWVKRNNKLKAMKDFASRVKVENRAKSLNPAPKRKEMPKEKSNRQKALEFAKNIPKPKPIEKRKSKVKQMKTTDEYIDEDDMMAGLEYDMQEPQYTQLDELNQKHEEYVNEVNDIKKLFM